MAVRFLNEALLLQALLKTIMGTIFVIDGPFMVLHGRRYFVLGPCLAFPVPNLELFEYKKSCQWPYATCH